VTLLGKRVFCRHCGGGFPARDGTSTTEAITPDASLSREVAELSLAERVDHLLARASLVLARSAAGGTWPPDASGSGE